MTLRHTKPDFGAPTTQLSSPAYTADVLEGLGRIGAIGLYTRGGKVLYATSFEDGLAGWVQKISGTGAISIDNAIAFHGAASVKMTPQSASAFDVLLEKRFPLMFHTRYGLEALISMDALATGFELFLGFLSQKYGTVPQYAVKYDQPSATLKYLDSAGNFTTFASSIPDLRNISGDASPIWILAKLLVSADPSAFGYHAFVLNDLIYDMRALDYRNTASASPNPRLTAQVWAFDTSGGQHPTRVDCLLLTTDEPAYVS